MKQFVKKKYDGDDQQSWALFKAADVKGMGSIICYGEASPIMCGMDRLEAQYHVDKFNKAAV